MGRLYSALVCQQWLRDISQRFQWIALLVFMLACTAADASAAAHQPSQSDVESVYLFDFGKFVRWPADANQSIQICVDAPQPFVDGLQSLVASERIDGPAPAVRRVQRAEDALGCSILFIDSSGREDEAVLLAAVADKPTLTVSDLPDFLSRGGMIQFVLIQNHVRFAVDLKAVAQSNLSLSSEMLKVAVSVKGRPKDGAQ